VFQATAKTGDLIGKCSICVENQGAVAIRQASNSELIGVLRMPDVKLPGKNYLAITGTHHDAVNENSYRAIFHLAVTPQKL
jgi:hypothetical protein